jgi:purine-binding chemotaxis protein CheW
MNTNCQICTFSVDGNLFGVDVNDVQEVLRYQELTKVPLAPAVVSGLINLRGEIVTALDMRRRLRLPVRPNGSLPMNVVVQTKDGPVSLLVDEIGDVLEVDEQMFEPAPPTLAATVRELITGVYKLEDQLLLVINTERATDLAPIESELEAIR